MGIWRIVKIRIADRVGGGCTVNRKDEYNDGCTVGSKYQAGW